MENTEKVVKEKLQAYYVNVKNQLQGIREENEKRSRRVFENCEKMVKEGLKEISEVCAQHIEGYKKKNNAYWQKIKETLGKMNARICGVEDTAINIGKQINKFESEMR